MSKTEIMHEYGNYLLDRKHHFGPHEKPINFEEFSKWLLTLLKECDIIST